MVPVQKTRSSIIIYSWGFAHYLACFSFCLYDTYIPQPGNDIRHLPVKRPAVTEVSQYSEMDDAADPDTEGFPLFGSLQTCRLTPAAFFFTSPKCHPLHHCQPLITASLLVLYPEGHNSSAECHYFECNINWINILTPCLPNAGKWSHRYSG